MLASVPDEGELLAWGERLASHGVGFVIFREPDIGDAATAISTEPITGALRRHFKRLPLWKAPGAASCPNPSPTPTAT